MKKGIKIIGTAVLVSGQSLNICPLCCCGMKVIDVNIEDFEKVELTNATSAINEMKKMVNDISDENYGKDFVGFTPTSNKYSEIVVILNSSIREKIKDEENRKLVKEFGDTGLYFWILGVMDGNVMNNYSLEAVKDKKNTFKLVNKSTGAK